MRNDLRISALLSAALIGLLHGSAALGDALNGVTNLGADSWDVRDGYYLNGSTNNGLFYNNNTASTSCETSGIGLNENGANVLCTVPLNPILDINIGVYPVPGAGTLSRWIPRFNEDWFQQANSYTLSSKNDQIQPGGFATSDPGWANGDTAQLNFTWNGGSASVSCTVVANTMSATGCNVNPQGKAGANAEAVIAGLSYQFAQNATLAAANFYLHDSPGDAPIPGYIIGGTAYSYGKSFLVTRTIYNNGSGWSFNSSGSSRTIAVANPVNSLDGPVGFDISRISPKVSPSSRDPQNGDLNGGLYFHGAYEGAPAGGIPMAVIQSLTSDVSSATGPTGQLQFITQCKSGSGGANGNGCLRMIVNNGISIPETSGSFNDNGWGSYTAPSTGGFFIAGRTSLDINGGVATISDTSGLKLDTPNTKSCGSGLFTDSQGNVGCVTAAAWTAYTPTVSCGAGTLTSASASGRYKQTPGTKTVAITISVSITTDGSCSNYLIVSMPSSVQSDVVLAGREQNITGFAGTLSVAAGATNATLVNYDNSYPGGTGRKLVYSGVYEIP